MSLDERVSYDAENNVVYANFEGMNIGTEEEAEKLVAYSTVTSRDSGVRCTLWSTTTTSTSADARDTFFAMVKYNEDNYFLSSTRYLPTHSLGTSSRRTSPRPTSSSASTATSTRHARACGCGTYNT